jgi:hypothetical protein
VKINKGSYGYIENNKKIFIIKALSGLGIILATFVTGLILTKSRLNWFTFAAVMLALPVGRIIVNMIMTLPHQSMDQEAYNKIKVKENGITILYDLVITSYEMAMQIDSVAIKGNTLCALSTDQKLSEEKAEKYIKNILANNGCHASIKIYKDMDSYLTRIDEIRNNFNTNEKSDTAKEREKNKEDRIVTTLCDISL